MTDDQINKVLETAGKWLHQSLEESYSPISMVERAVRNARPHSTVESPRWVAVRDVFGYGSTTSVKLCEQFGLDPYENVPGVWCDCNDDE